MKKRTAKQGVKKEPRTVHIWLDHSEATVSPRGPDEKPRSIASGIVSRVRIPGEGADGVRLGNYRSTNNEAHKHNRRQGMLRSYYKKIASFLDDYDEVEIAGPATAAKELFNFLASSPKFKDKKVYILTGKRRKRAG